MRWYNVSDSIGVDTHGGQVKLRNVMSKKAVDVECVDVHLDALALDELVGKILTMIDASVAPGAQCEALKSVIKQSIWAWGVRPQPALTVEQMNQLQTSGAEPAPQDAEFPLKTYPR